VSDKRVSICDEYLGVERFEAEVLSAVDYYPFGMMMPDRQWYANSDSSIAVNGFNGMRKDNEIRGVGNSLDFGARIYDSRLGRWMSTDPREHEDPPFSTYSAFANSPLLFVDPNGEKYLNFNQAGEFTGVTKDTWWHNLFVGNKGRVLDASGNVERNFSFADEAQDPQDIIDGKITKLIFVTSGKIELMLYRAGAFDPANRTENKPLKERYDYILKEGKGDGGKLDFSYTQIPHVFPDASKQPLKTSSTVIFLVDNMAHNHMNFGNFLLGAAGQSLGYSAFELSWGAHYNGVFNSETNGGYKPEMDTPDDQKSIQYGYDYAKDNGYENIVWTRDQYESGGMPEKR